MKVLFAALFALSFTGCGSEARTGDAFGAKVEYSVLQGFELQVA